MTGVLPAVDARRRAVPRPRSIALLGRDPVSGGAAANPRLRWSARDLRLSVGMEPLLPHLEIGAPRQEAEMCVVLMHGLGADGHDFEDVAEAISRAALPRRWRFILPHAPEQPVTINMGMVMPAWYDILDLSESRRVNWGTVATSAVAIESLIAREEAAKLVLAGFSQGAAMALHVGLRNQGAVAGILAMSGYLLIADDHPCPQKAVDIPIGLFHGADDPVVPVGAARQAAAVLGQEGYAPTLKIYDGLGHGVADEELRDVFAWFDAACPTASSAG